MKETIEQLKQKLANREGLKADEVRDGVAQLQKQSLKLFEAAYRKMAEKNSPNNIQSYIYFIYFNFDLLRY